ncbi:MAG: P-loop NTPase [Spirochaetia bacterium]
MSISEQSVMDALSHIIDPDFGQDIVSLGFVRNLEIEGPQVSFAIQLTTPACPIKDQFKTQAEQQVGAIPGVESVKVAMTSAVKKRTPKVENSGLKEVQSIIAVASGKGGVGKSTVAASIARELSGRGYRVGLLDTDIFGPSVPSLFNLHEQQLYQDSQQMMIPVEAGGLSLMSFGFLLGDSPAIMRGPMVSGYVQQLLHQVAWGPLDYLILDLPPGTGDIQLTITQAVELGGSVIVTTPQALAYADVIKGIMMFDRVNVPVLGVIENMSYFDCGNCNTRHRIFGEGGAKRLSERFGIDVLAELPLSPEQYGGTLEASPQNTDVSQAVDNVIRALGKANLEGIKRPEVGYDAESVRLYWREEDLRIEVPNKILRLDCRCAACVYEYTGEKRLEPDSIPDDIHAEDVQTIGNYAVAITWSDGHSSGFFSYKQLQELAGVAT